MNLIYCLLVLKNLINVIHYDGKHINHQIIKGFELSNDMNYQVIEIIKFHLSRSNLKK